jgi:hypothetical protein
LIFDYKMLARLGLSVAAVGVTGFTACVFAMAKVQPVPVSLTDVPITAANFWNVFSLDNRPRVDRWFHRGGHVMNWNEETPHPSAAPGTYRAMALVAHDNTVLSGVNYQYMPTWHPDRNGPLSKIVDGKMIRV